RPGADRTGARSGDRVARGAGGVTGRAGRRVAVLASGTVVGQLLVVLASPALTRLYDPEGFGVLGVFVSLLSILGVVVGLRYPLAVPLPDTDEAASDALVLSVVSVAAVSSLFAVGTWLTRDWLVATFGLE